jgi:hypothetical protein
MSTIEFIFELVSGDASVAILKYEFATKIK